VIIDCAAYVDGERRPGTLDLTEALEATEEPGAFVWIGLLEPSREEFAAVEEELRLHKLAVEDAVHAHQRPKVEVYEHNIFVVLRTARYDDEREIVEFGELHLFIGDQYVVTVRHGAPSGLAQVRRGLEAQPERMRLGAPAVLYAVLDHVVDDYKPVVQGLDNDISEIEADVFSDERRNPAQRIYQLKRETLELYRNTRPLLEPLQQLSRGTLPCSPVELRPFFRDVAEHLAMVVSEIEDFRDSLSDALAANLAQVSVRQNDDMRKISAWVAIAAVPTLVGAIYGMNFDHMPELAWELGYPAALLLMGIVCFLLYRRFRASGWL
jgi:magnesium transporter